MSPSMIRAPCPLFASGQVKPWYQADYNVREIANSEFHQDIPALLWRLSNTIPDSARREARLRPPRT